MVETGQESIAAILAREAEDVGANRERIGPMHRTRPPREPAQVYSIRMPVEKLEELRREAEAAGMTPSALMREWVLERLASQEADPDDRLSQAMRSGVNELIRQNRTLRRQLSRLEGQTGRPVAVARARTQGTDPEVLENRRLAIEKGRKNMARKRAAQRDART